MRESVTVQSIEIVTNNLNEDLRDQELRVDFRGIEPTNLTEVLERISRCLYNLASMTPYPFKSGCLTWDDELAIDAQSGISPAFILAALTAKFGLGTVKFEW